MFLFIYEVDKCDPVASHSSYIQYLNCGNVGFLLIIMAQIRQVPPSVLTCMQYDIKALVCERKGWGIFYMSILHGYKIFGYKGLIRYMYIRNAGAWRGRIVETLINTVTL